MKKEIMFVDKFENHFQLKGIPVDFRDDVPEGALYFINPSTMFSWPKKKDGTPDMRYSINKGAGWRGYSKNL